MMAMKRRTAPQHGTARDNAWQDKALQRIPFSSAQLSKDVMRCGEWEAEGGLDWNKAAAEAAAEDIQFRLG